MSWSKKEESILIQNYNGISTKDLLDLLPNRSISAIKNRAYQLNLKRNVKIEHPSIWSDIEILTLKDSWANTSKKEIIDLIPNRTYSAIMTKAGELGLKKNKDITTIWSDEELEILIENYEKCNTKDLIPYLNNKTLKQIQRKAGYLNLRKNEKFLQDMRCEILFTRNKKKGRNLTYEYISYVASKYKTRGDFQIHDASAYTTARKNGWLDQVSEHMLPQKYSIPQIICQIIFDALLNTGSIYNCRSVITPYELDVYYSKYKLAIEYNGRGWHNGENPKSKNIIERDILKQQLCLDSGITLITIVENSRDYEIDIKEQIKNNRRLINSICGTNITKDDIDNVLVDYSSRIMDLNEAKEICNSYTDYTLWKKENTSLYYKLRKCNRLHEFTSHMQRKQTIWTIDKVKSEISKYKTLKDFYTNAFGCYLYCKKNKIKINLPKSKIKSL
jgi:hypothetical protein